MTWLTAVLTLLACAPPAPDTPVPGATADAKLASPCDVQAWYADADGDGRGDRLDVVYSTLCLYPGRTITWGDCDDTDAAVNRGAQEVCDGIDNDCDGLVDGDDTPLFGSDAANYYLDGDGDGYGDPSTEVRSCEEPSGMVEDGSDCDDADAAVNPGATEICDSLDNDCDGAVDGLDDDATGTTTWYLDYDGDGYGSTRLTRDSCSMPANFVADSTDCNDLSAESYPGAEETCDEDDNDCDGATDEGLDVDWYRDADGDGFGGTRFTVSACESPTGFVDNDTDCDDDNVQVSPNAVELCDGQDNDCDGTSDGTDAWDVSTFYEDGDGDGYGLASSTTDACDTPSGYAADEGDCDDADAAVSPGAEELCDTVDNDCDGDTDESDAVDASTWVIDADGDGYGSADASFSVDSCDQPTGFTDDLTDCDDADSTVYVGASETCGDGIDSDCDGRGGPDDDEDGDGLTWTQEQAAGTDDCDAGSTVDCTTVDITNVVIFSADDATELCACTTSVDQLYVNATGLDPLDLSCLVTVTDKLEVENSDAASVDLSGVTSVGGDLYVHDNGEIASVDLSSLDTVGGHVTLQSNGELESLDLTGLTTVTGQFYLYDNDSLESLDLPSLTTVGSNFYVYNNDQMETLTAPVLSSLSDELYVVYNQSLVTLSFPSLTSVPSQVQIEENYDLESLDLSALETVSSSFYLRYNYVMDAADLASLQSISGSLYMMYNYELDTFDLSSLETVGSEFYFYYHSDLTTLSMPALTSISGVWISH